METVDILLRFKPEREKEEDLANAYKLLAISVNDSELESREKTIAIERLEESFMWAKRGIVNKEDYDEEITYGLV